MDESESNLEFLRHKLEALYMQSKAGEAPEQEILNISRQIDQLINRETPDPLFRRSGDHTHE